ncbi:formate dehydrogenase accessory sulfurtransferase FdhD [Chitinophaga sp. sic0106]|uniref:formate dehydrogenase accessory sulfurtransferase FdhD n=1 Tax=Chitinophaga sp. sic0106 TaxID=2854785 RepID=UPI001C4647F4|nr:formate dehydrogenase accessory sulfurtransferase FdhD [Chitinophaga sp. sic0106]MBV7530002.1 formate dehydrogenase accessory sulfurtransferase FdhD [Chitinophaga sp. sic0106]
MTKPVVHTRVKKVLNSGMLDSDDVLATEEPLEIRIISGPTHNRRQQQVSVTMRTPGNDEDLAAGFLFSEGVINAYDAIAHTKMVTTKEGSIITVTLRENVTPQLGNSQRNFTATAACGMCGKTDISNIHTGAGVSNAQLATTAETIFRLPETLRVQQSLFESTGGIHAAALFDNDGELIILQEDIGRHNAVDKVIGTAMREAMFPLDQHLLLLSGRAGFELIQKAAMAGIPVVAAVGAPSSMAVRMAEQWNITLIGFLREQRFNIYSGAHRVEI